MNSLKSSQQLCEVGTVTLPVFKMRRRQQDHRQKGPTDFSCTCSGTHLRSGRCYTPSVSFFPSRFFTSHFLTPQAELGSCGRYNMRPSTGGRQTTEVRSLTSVQRPEVNLRVLAGSHLRLSLACSSSWPPSAPLGFWPLLSLLQLPAAFFSAGHSRTCLHHLPSPCISHLLPAYSQRHPATRPWARRSHSVSPPL